MLVYTVVEENDHGGCCILYVTSDLEKAKKKAKEYAWNIYTRWHTFWERFLKGKGNRETLYKSIGRTDHIVTYYDTSCSGSPARYVTVGIRVNEMEE